MRTTVADVALLRSVAQDYRNNVPAAVRERLVELSDRICPPRVHKCATCGTPLPNGESWCWYCGQISHR